MVTDVKVDIPDTDEEDPETSIEPVDERPKEMVPDVKVDIPDTAEVDPEASIKPVEEGPK